MVDIRIVIVLTVASVILTSGVVIVAIINPFAVLGLAPVLMAVAVIIHSIRDSKDGE